MTFLCNFIMESNVDEVKASSRHSLLTSHLVRIIYNTVPSQIGMTGDLFIFRAS